MILNKVKFFLKKPILIVVIGQEKEKIKEIVFRILKNKFKINKEVFIFEADEKKINEFFFFFKNSKLPVLAINSLDQKLSISIDDFPPATYFVLNCDDQKIKELGSFDCFKKINFGLKEKCDIFISDIKENGGINFKINYKGSVVPFWFKKKLDKIEISAVLTIVSIALILGLNLVEISESLKEIY